MKISLRVSGGGIGRVAARIAAAGTRSSREMAKQVAGISQTLVPKTRGDLHDTMRIEEKDGKAVIRYGGRDAPHAVSCHKNNYRYTRGRRWKYLDAAMDRVAADPSAGQLTGGAFMDELIGGLGGSGGGLRGFRPYSPRWWRN